MPITRVTSNNRWYRFIELTSFWRNAIYKRLSAARPWRLVVWVKGFVGIRHALKFESAWQAGLRGRDLRHVSTTCGGNVSGKLRLLSSPLRAERCCPHHLRLSYVDRARATGRLENANLHVWTNVERVPADVRHG